MIPRKPNLLITQLSDKRLRCPANTSSQAGKVQGKQENAFQQDAEFGFGGTSVLSTDRSP